MKGQQLLKCILHVLTTSSKTSVQLHKFRFKKLKPLYANQMPELPIKQEVKFQPKQNILCIMEFEQLQYVKLVILHN